MTYLIRALATILDCFPIEREIDCAVLLKKMNKCKQIMIKWKLVYFRLIL
jgi:hypothetical protein